MARKSRRGGGSSDEDVNLTPMLDVTFILLIFFIVTAQFIKEPGVPIDRQDVRNDDFVSPLGILIAIDENSDIYINKKKIEQNELNFYIRDLREQNKKGQIVVQVDKDSRAGAMETVMVAIQDADPGARINIATSQD